MAGIEYPDWIHAMEDYVDEHREVLRLLCVLDISSPDEMAETF